MHNHHRPQKCDPIFISPEWFALLIKKLQKKLTQLVGIILILVEITDKSISAFFSWMPALFEKTLVPKLKGLAGVFKSNLSFLVLIVTFH